jgi:DNA polymerase-3 subunit gamma/tau
MLLKGLGEVNEAPDRRTAAEMVLIRLAHVAELPTPGDLVRRLTDGAAPAGVPRPAPNGTGGAPRAASLRGDPGGGLRAMGGGQHGPAGAAALADAVAAPARAEPTAWREVVALASGRRPMLHAHLVHSVHPVRIAPGRLEIRPLPAAPRDLAGQLGALLQEATGSRWTITLSNAEGEPTLAEQGRAAEASRLALAQSHPLVQAVLAAFPGASIEAVRDAGADAYGLGGALGGALAGPARSEEQPEAEPGDIPPIEPGEPAGYDDVPPPDEER